MQARTLVKTNNLTEAEWLEWRKFGIGGSDIAAIAGLSPFKSALAVYADKLGLVERENSPEQEEMFHWGHVLEPIIADEFKRRTGLKVQRVNAILQHPEIDWMLADIDRLIRCPKRGEGVLECKTVHQFAGGKWEEDKVPMDYQCQIQWYMAVTGLPYAYAAGLIGGRKFVYPVIERDDDVIAYLKQLAADFWKCVQDRTPPAIDGSDTTKDILGELFKDTTTESIDLPPEAEGHITAYNQAKDDEKAAKERKEEAANNIRFLMGNHELASCSKFQLSWKPVSTERFDSKRFKAEQPALAANYINESTSRRLTIKAAKK